jgi:hypothetical protein
LNVDRNHQRADRFSDLNRRQANTPTAVNRNPLPRTNPRLINQCPKSRNKATPKACCRRIINRFGKPNQIHVRMLDDDLVCKSTPMSKARLTMGIANVGIASNALKARSTATAEWNRDAFPHTKSANILPNAADDPREFMSWDMW